MRPRLPRPFLLLMLVTAPLQAAPGTATLTTFRVDVTPPLGHACMGGGISPVKSVAQPLEARGFVLTVPPERPFVVASFDWCEIRGSAYDDWRAALAEVAQTEPQRVMISATHVHDAPVMDPEAEFLLRAAEQSGAWKKLPAPAPQAPIQLASVCWPDFNRLCIQRAKAALAEALKKPRTITHFGTGRARVERISANRRFMLPNGGISHGRGSRSGGNAEAAAAGEGDIDPWLRTLSFWDGETPVCALHSYAVHPMSLYGSGVVGIDFVGLAREKFQAEHPGVLTLYASGASGNVTAGKYNDGSDAAREGLIQRLHAAMAAAWAQTERHELKTPAFRNAKIPLGARNTIAHTEATLRHRLLTDPAPFGRAESAMGLAWYERVKSGHQIDLPCVDLGAAQLLLLPAEAYVEFQLYAQSLRPESFVMCLGYGECGPGYIPIERAWRENDSNLRDWAWVGPGSEEVMKGAVRKVLGRQAEN